MIFTSTACVCGACPYEFSHVWVYVHGVHTYSSTTMCWPEVDLVTLPWWFSTWKQGLSSKPRAHHLASLASQLAPGSLCLHLPMMGLMPHPPGFYKGSGDLNSCPHTCRASIFTTEPSPQPQWLLISGSKYIPTNLWKKVSKRMLIIALKIPDAVHIVHPFFSDTYFSVLFFVCMRVLSACIYGHHLHAHCPQTPEEGTGSPGTGVVRVSVTMWVLRNEPGSFGNAAIRFLTTEPSLPLQPQWFF